MRKNYSELYEEATEFKTKYTKEWQNHNGKAPYYRYVYYAKENFLRATQAGDLAELKKILNETHLPINCVNEHNQNALFVLQNSAADLKRRLKIQGYLLHRQINVDQIDNDGNNVLMYAIKQRSVLSWYYLSLVKNINHRNNLNETFLFYLHYVPEKQLVEMQERLSHYDIDYTVKNHQQQFFFEVLQQQPLTKKLTDLLKTYYMPSAEQQLLLAALSAKTAINVHVDEEKKIKKL